MEKPNIRRVCGPYDNQGLGEACNLKLDNLISFQIVAEPTGIEIHATYRLPHQKLEEVKTVLRGLQNA